MTSNSISKRKSRQILYNQGILEKIMKSMEDLGWECYDDVEVEIIGSKVVIKNNSKKKINAYYY